MARVKKKRKVFGGHLWEFFKWSIPSALMYFCAGSILMMVTLKKNEVFWDNSKLMWSLICMLCAAAYNAMMMYGYGGTGYEMLVSGNIKRSSVATYGENFKMSSHKYAREYRVWKGFIIGLITGLYPIIFGVLFGLNQEAMSLEKGTLATAILLLVGFFLSGWSVLPIYYMNANGMQVSYFISCAFAIVPIVVSGVFYILGAYGRRNKVIREQMIADRAAQAEATKEKKINYGGLPGTKPKKRK